MVSPQPPRAARGRLRAARALCASAPGAAHEARLAATTGIGHAAGASFRAIKEHLMARRRSSLRGVCDFLARILVYPPYLPRFCRRTAAAACALTTESTLSDFPPAI